MRYELAHDSLARQILERVSGKDKARRQARLLVERAYQRYQLRQVLLNQEDLDEIRPHESSIRFSPEERRFIQESKNALSRAARRKRQTLLGIISLLSILLLIALWQWQRSVASTKALRAKAAYEAGRVSEAFRLAQSAHKTWGIDQDTRTTVDEVLHDLAASGLQRDLIHEGSVSKLDIDPKEQFILSITQGPTAFIWDLAGRLQASLEHPSDLVDGRFIPWQEERQSLIVAADSTAYFWDGNGKLLRQYKTNAPIQGFDFNRRRRLVLLWTTQEVVLLNEQGEPLSFRSPVSHLIQASFSPNGEDLLLANADSVSSWWLEFIRIGRPQSRLVIRGDIRWASYVASDQIQMQLLVQFANGSTRIYDHNGLVDSSSYYQYLNREFERLPNIQRFAFSSPGRDNPKVLFQTDSVSVRYWSAYRKHTDGERAGVIDFYTRYDQAILNTTFSGSGRFLLTASADGRVDIWDIQSTNIQRYKRFRALIRDAHFLENDRYLITTSQDETIKIWQIDPIESGTPTELIDYYNDRLAPN